MYVLPVHCRKGPKNGCAQENHKNYQNSYLPETPRAGRTPLQEQRPQAPLGRGQVAPSPPAPTSPSTPILPFAAGHDGMDSTGTTTTA